MNPPAEIPDSYDKTRLQLLEKWISILPSKTVDNTPQQFFTRPFSLSDIQAAVKHIKSRNLHTSKGIDGVSYQEILEIPLEMLQNIFNSCLDSLDIPNSCNYRLVGLESCFLKFMTLLVDRRLREWADANKVIPPSQNGFRPKYRTNNNSFILKCAIDKAKAIGKPLYIVFVDISNAFPSTNQAALWWGLYKKGVAGPIFD
ncbi:hypothetical protein SCHPADRAFT_812801, partial [Schizopora paradoxa]